MRSAADTPLDVKLGQMMMIGIPGSTRDAYGPFLERIARYHVGGVWLTDADSPMCRVAGNIQSPEQLARLTADLHTSSQIPLLVCIDGEGGQIIRIKQAYGFPAFASPAELGQRDDVEHTRTKARRLASTLAELGFNMNFAPVVDVNRNPDNPVIGSRGRSFSSDAAAVARHACAFVEAHHACGLLCTLKHFPGHGSSSTDSHLGLVDVTQTWSPDELVPYRELIARGLADAVLSAHVFIRHLELDRPATLSPRIMTTLLREELGFGGVLFSDDVNMGAIAQHYAPEESLAAAVNAGIDVIVNGNCMAFDERVVENTIGRLRRLVEAGRIPMSRIDEAFERTQALKARLRRA